MKSVSVALRLAAVINIILIRSAVFAGIFFSGACDVLKAQKTDWDGNLPVGMQLTNTQSPDGYYISWREHVIDEESTGGSELRGGDGLIVADIDRDGYPDIVSVHESDTEYNGTPDALIRIAFGSNDPERWDNVTLASGNDAAAPEDVSAADLIVIITTLFA